MTKEDHPGRSNPRAKDGNEKNVGFLRKSGEGSYNS
jgi:hypothetical protein